MSQYLSAEIVKKDTKEVIARMSLSLRIRDMNRNDFFDKCFTLDDKKYTGAYKGDAYEGTIGVQNIANCIDAKKDEIKKYEKKLATSEKRLSNANTKDAIQDAKDSIITFEEILEDLQYDLEALENWLVCVDYELDGRAYPNKEYKGYPSSLGMKRSDVEINLWLNY